MATPRLDDYIRELAIKGSISEISCSILLEGRPSSTGGQQSVDIV